MINMTVLREDLRRWKARSGWSGEHISFAIRLTVDGAISATAINHFLTGERRLTEPKAQLVRDFITAWPVVDCYSNWHRDHVIPAAIKHFGKEEHIRARVEMLEQQRARERAAWLAMERKPQRSRWPAGIIPSAEMLDAARRL